MIDFLEIIGIVVTSIILMLAIIFGCIFTCEVINYKLSESYCTAYVDNKEVYKGRCHFLSINSIGENGNSKKLTVYKDVIKVKAIKEYVSENIKVNSDD